MLQQYLPFTVLKPFGMRSSRRLMMLVKLQQYLPFTVLKRNQQIQCMLGILRQLQQYLPFTVLKQVTPVTLPCLSSKLQQYLPFTVLKRPSKSNLCARLANVATVLTVYGIETFLQNHISLCLLVATVLTVYGIETGNGCWSVVCNR